MLVTKRDGREVPFCKEKISSAIMKAYKSVYDCTKYESCDDITEFSE